VHLPKLTFRRVLRSAAGLNTGDKRIEFVGRLETAKVFRASLGLISDGQVELPRDLAGVRNLGLFLQKWDCPAALSNPLRAVQVGVLRGSIWGVYAFILAAVVHDQETAEVALGGPAHCWGEEGGPVGGTLGRNCLDPRAWPSSLYGQLKGAGDPKYAWALAWAFEDTGGDPSRLPAKFGEYLAKPWA
jgi:hypothetical protein